MKFLYPQVLWALTALVIPVIIHLFHFRRFKNIYFSNTEFLRQVRNEKETKNKLKNLLTLITRLVILTMLILAFAQPYFISSSTLSSGKNAISIYLDNSPSMENTGKENSLLEEAKNVAGNIIESSGENDAFQLLTNAMTLREQRYFNQEICRDQTEQLSLNATPKKLSTLLIKMNTSLQEQKTPGKRAYIISDFQKTTTDPDNFSFDTSVNYFFIPLIPESFDNLSIDSAWFFSPFIKIGQEAELHVRVRNHSDNDQKEITLRFNLNNIQKIITFSIESRQTLDLRIPFIINSKGWNKGVLAIDDYPVSFDDRYFISFYVADKANILIINESKDISPLLTLYKTDNYFNVNIQDPKQIDFSLFEQQEVIILNELASFTTGLITELTSFLKKGGNLLIFPPASNNINSGQYTSMMNSIGLPPFGDPVEEVIKITSVESKSFIFNGVFDKVPQNINLPIVKKYYPRKGNRYSSEMPVLSLANKQLFLSSARFGKGHVFICAVPLNKEWSNFQNHSLFVPLLYQISIYNANMQKISYFPGLDKVIELNGKNKNPNKTIKLVKDDKSFMPEYSIIGGSSVIQINNMFDEAGFYDLLLNGMDDEHQIIAINQARAESQLEVYSPEELKKILPEFIKIIKLQGDNTKGSLQLYTNGKPLWRKFIWFALIFLLAEVLIIRYVR